MNCSRCNKKNFKRGIICDCGLNSFTIEDSFKFKEDYFLILEDGKFIYDLSWYNNLLTVHKGKLYSPKPIKAIIFKAALLNISLTSLNTLITFS